MDSFLLNDRLKIFDGTAIKIIALITMLIDHIGASLFPTVLPFRMIGRIAFPLYCFLLTQGAVHTRNRSKYLLRLAVFGLISELPFDLALKHVRFYWMHQNVFFTLLIGLAMIFAIEYRKEAVLDPAPRGIKKSILAVPQSFFDLGVLAVALVLANLLHTDYNWFGVALIFVFYYCKEPKWLQYLLIIMLLFSMSTLEAYGSLALIPITLYNGERGRTGNKLKYAFYAFYPIHLTVLAIIYYMC